MKSLEIPTRENTWMFTWWVPLIVFVVLTLFRHMPTAVYWIVDVVLAMALFWAMWQLWQKSTLELTSDAILAKRGGKVVRQIAVTDISRISVSRSALGIFVKDGGRFPKLSRGIRIRSAADRATCFQNIARWSRAHKVEFVQNG